MSGLILPTRKKIKCIAEMTLKSTAIAKGVNNAHMVSFFLFFPKVNGITHIIKTSFFHFSFFFFFLETKWTYNIALVLGIYYKMITTINLVNIHQHT